MRVRRILLLIIVGWLWPFMARGESSRPLERDSFPIDTTTVDSTQSSVVKNDTILFVPPVFVGELAVTDTTNLEERLHQNPTTALFRSLLIPGWGQLANGKPIKAGLFAGLQGWCIGAIVHYGNAASNFRDEYEASTVTANRNQYYAMYKDRRQERNKYMFFLGLTTLVSVFDAYVDAHLTGSPAHPEKRVALNLQPQEDGFQGMLAVRF